MTEGSRELLPCPNPWCGENRGWAHHIEGFALWRIRCGRCGLQGPAKDTEAEAITAWNTRASRTAPDGGREDDVERVAWSIRVNRVGVAAAQRSKDSNSDGWKDAIADARAAIAAMPSHLTRGDKAT